MIDIHSHTPKAGAVYNLTLEELRQQPPYPDGEQWISVGLHPWDLTQAWEKDFNWVRIWASLPQVKAIGETGFDRLHATPCQEEAFVAHALLAEEVGKPLIIHCVKAADDLLRLHREIRPRQPWIWHGFRGNPQQVAQLVQKGISLSFGEHFNPLSVKACPDAYLYMETDDSMADIQEIAQRILALR